MLRRSGGQGWIASEATVKRRATPIHFRID
jgi:hypothetical protein